MIALIIILPFLVGILWFVISFFGGRNSIDVDGTERFYHIHVPSSYDEDQPMPLLLMFHMRMGNAWLMQEITQFNQLADEEGFIVVYPDGYRRSWADGSQRYESDKAGIDDVAFTQALLTELSAQYAIDEEQLFVTGFSNGGFLTHRLGCELSEQIAGIATVSGVMAENVLQTCEAAQLLPVMMIHGSGDKDIAWGGKPPELASVPATIEKWVALNDCDPDPTIEHLDPAADTTTLVRETYDCPEGAQVIFYKIVEGGHRWPGASNQWQYWLSGNLSQDIDASEEIWSFFSEIGE